MIKKAIIPVLLCASIVFSGCATDSQQKELENKVDNLESRIEDIEDEATEIPSNLIYNYYIDDMSVDKVVSECETLFSNVPEEGETYEDYYASITPTPVATQDIAKASLTVEEAAEYSNIGVNRLRELCKEPTNNFCFFIGRKILIKREAFDEYLRKTTAL